MAAYTKKQLETSWVRNGGPPSEAAKAASIAFAESKGNREPAGDVGLGGKGATSFGPYQVHTPAHPEYSPSLLENNLDYSTKAALKISNGGTDWSPWTTYKTGAYKAYLTSEPGGAAGSTSGGQQNASFLTEALSGTPLDQAKAGLKALESVGGGGGIGGVFSGIEKDFAVLATIGEWLSEPLRVVKLAGGSVLVVMGLHTLVRGTGAPQAVHQTTAVPRGTLKLARRAAETAAAAA